MKLSKPTQWILLIGIFAILVIAAGVAWGHQMTEQSQLSSDIAQAQQDFTKYTAQKKDLETKLSRAQSDLASVQNEFRQYTESVEINEALFEAADDASVTITRLSSSIPADEQLNGITYSAFSLSIAAKGEFVELLNFTDKVSEIFSASTIGPVSISVSGGGGNATIGLQVKVYAYETK